MKVRIEKDTLFIELPIETYTSTSGKSLVVASTHGNKQTGVQYKGKGIVLGVNAYTPKS